MGEVYRARDRRFNRDIAIEILPYAFAPASTAWARFTREAHSLAALNRPHIARIYGIEESAHRAGVMELVEGDRSPTVARGAMPFDEALPDRSARSKATAARRAAQSQTLMADLPKSFTVFVE